MLTKIISGCQTGAEVGALLAAEELALATGGYMPKGFKTENGPRPDLAARFGLRETFSSGYASRTFNNVFAGDGTLIFGRPESKGCKLTAFYALRLHKPVFAHRWPENEFIANGAAFQYWLKVFKISTLNVAGNREEKNPGIEKAVKAFLIVNISSYLSLAVT